MYEFAHCFWNVSGCPAASSVRAAPCQLPRRGSSCTVPLGVGFIDTPQESSKKPSPTGKGDRPQAVDEGRYGVVHCRNNGRRGRNVSTDSPTVSGMFQAAPPPHQSGLRPASFPGGEALVSCFEVPGFIDTPQESSKKPSPPGKGDRPQAVDEGRYGVAHCRNNRRRGRNFLRIRLQFLQCFRPPRRLISQGCALPASPAGKLLYRAFRCRVYRHAPGKL